MTRHPAPVGPLQADSHCTHSGAATASPGAAPRGGAVQGHGWVFSGSHAHPDRCHSQASTGKGGKRMSQPWASAAQSQCSPAGQTRCLPVRVPPPLPPTLGGGGRPQTYVPCFLDRQYQSRHRQSLLAPRGLLPCAAAGALHPPSPPPRIFTSTSVLTSPSTPPLS